jgi:hypothetical protein
MRAPGRLTREGPTIAGAGAAERWPGKLPGLAGARTAL